jgi:CRISPR-associated protein Cas1
MQDVLACEAEHAGVYWRRWKGQEMRFKGPPVPDGWHTFHARARSWRTGKLGETGKQFSNRFALHPMNAMLNYAGAIIAAQCARACAGLGLDPAFGVLHSARPGMAALAWDTFELLRAPLDAAVFSFASRRVYEAGEFAIVPDPKPHLRFSSSLARELAGHVMRRVTFLDCVGAARKVVRLMRGAGRGVRYPNSG